MEVCLFGLFLLVRDSDKDGYAVGNPCYAQAIIMGIVFVATAIYQWLMNKAFSPLFRYLPVSLENEAVIRDEEFARAQEYRWHLDENEQPGEEINDVPAAREQRLAEEVEMKEIEARRELGGLSSGNLDKIVLDTIGNPISAKETWADRSRNEKAHDTSKHDSQHSEVSQRHSTDLESQKIGADHISEALFAGVNDEIEDLTAEERDKLVRRAFQHQALRARRPVIWIPKDDLGVSDDEILRTQKLSKHIWISNEYTELDEKGRVVYRRSPPDFSELDLIEL